MLRNTQPEPWRVKVVEPIRRIDRSARLRAEPERLRGVRIVHQGPVLRHFTARFELI